MAGRVVGEVESGRERISIRGSTEVSQIADDRLQTTVCRGQIAADRPQQTEYRVTVIGIFEKATQPGGVIQSCNKKRLMFLTETKLQIEIKRDKGHDW